MFHRLLLALGLLLAGLLPASAAAVDKAFADWLEGTVWPLAAREGVSRASFDEATAGLEPDLSLPDLLPPGSKRTTPTGAFQAEFRSPGRYLSEKNLAGLEKAGRRQLKSLGQELAKVEASTGVPRAILLAIWGRESNYGTAEIPKDAIRTVATQAYMGSRPELFLPEFIALLKMVEADHLPRALMKSSWAGAMGQPQFLPSKFLAHAVDGDGDGRRDIWTSKVDTLASIGRYMADVGWQPGLPWGAEVILPDQVSCTLEGPDQPYAIADWKGAGVARTDGGDLSALGETAHLMMPAGRHGPAFLVTANFYALKRYNESDMYALFVGHLADRIEGPAKIRGKFDEVGGFTRGDVKALQEKLIAAGHDVGGADGLVGFRTRVAIGRVQAATGRPQTCFPDAALIRG